MKKKVWTVLILSILLIGCSWKNDYQKEYQEKQVQAKPLCENYGQKVLQIYYENEWNVICYQENPTKFFRKQID